MPTLSWVRREGLTLSGLLVCGAVALGFSSSGSAAPAVDVSTLSDAQLAGARVITGFDGKHPPAELRRMVTAGEVSGVILFDRNVGGRKSVRALISELQAIPRPSADNQPLLVSVDQEGGLVRRLPGPPKPSAEAVGQRGAAFAQRLGRATGSSLAAMGVNVDLAPVLDVGRKGRAIEGEHRSYGRDAATVSSIGVAFARGLAQRGIAATAKHFPGLGAARVNTDNAVQRIRLTTGKLRAVDEQPFTSFSSAGGAMVMLSTAVYPALSASPAAFAREIATVELRERLGFQGVSITDDLGSAAARAFGGATRTATAAAGAGVDLVLFGDLGSAAKAQRALRSGLGDGTLSRSEFQASAGRVLSLRSTLGS